MKKDTQSTVLDDSIDDPEPELSEVIHKGDIIALYTIDENHDYYLMKVTDPCYTVSELVFRDDWGNDFVRGSKIIKGLYFDKVGSLIYKLLPKKAAAVFPAAILFKMDSADLVKSRTSITLPEDIHLDILASILE